VSIETIVARTRGRRKSASSSKTRRAYTQMSSSRSFDLPRLMLSATSWRSSKKTVGNISEFYGQKFLEAAAALAEKDPGAFIRLRNNVLKPQGVAITTWERAVHEIQ